VSDHSFSDGDPLRLAHLLRIGTGRAGVWREDETRPLLGFELASSPAAQWPQLRSWMEQADPPIRTLRELLAHGEPPREALQFVRDVYEATDGETLPPQVTERIVGLAAARLAHEPAASYRKWLDDV